jgi:hypothetical protein
LVCNGLVSLLVGLEYSLLSSDNSPPLAFGPQDG